MMNQNNYNEQDNFVWGNYVHYQDNEEEEEIGQHPTQEEEFNFKADQIHDCIFIEEKREQNAFFTKDNFVDDEVIELNLVDTNSLNQLDYMKKEQESDKEKSCSSSEKSDKI